MDPNENEIHFGVGDLIIKRPGIVWYWYPSPPQAIARSCVVKANAFGSLGISSPGDIALVLGAESESFGLCMLVVASGGVVYWGHTAVQTWNSNWEKIDV